MAKIKTKKTNQHAPRVARGAAKRKTTERRTIEDLVPYYRGKKILVTGGTGSYGQAVTKWLLLQDPGEVRIYSRGENAQIEMARDFADPRLHFFIGDVRDNERLTEVMRGVDMVFHLAALKHVPVGERHIWEFVQTNIAGTRAVIEAVKSTGVQRAVFISTDKAADPVNVYGYTKAIAEKMFVAANAHSPNTKFVCIRSGNLTSSHGSVVPLFQAQIKSRNKITVTDPNMTRFLELPEELAAFVLRVAVEGRGGEVFIPKMVATDVATIAKVMIDALGNGRTKVEYIGVRPGEKFHEVLVSRDEMGRVMEFSDRFVVLPHKFLMDQMPQLASYFASGGERLTEQVYSSETVGKLSEAELKRILKSLGHLA